MILKIPINHKTDDEVISPVAINYQMPLWCKCQPHVFSRAQYFGGFDPLVAWVKTRGKMQRETHPLATKVLLYFNAFQDSASNSGNTQLNVKMS